MAQRPRDENDVDRMEFLLTLRRRGISDAAVLRAMDEVPRQRFVAPEFAAKAYADQALPIACGQTISQPYVVAYMTEQLALRREHRVLEIGTGTGYQTAVLSRLAREVVSIERFRTLAEMARGRCARWATTMSRSSSATASPARRTRRLSTASSSPPPPRACRKRWSISLPTIMASWCCRSDRASGAQHIIKLTKSQTGLARETLIPVRFVPLLPGQAREL